MSTAIVRALSARCGPLAAMFLEPRSNHPRTFHMPQEEPISRRAELNRLRIGILALGAALSALHGLPAAGAEEIDSPAEQATGLPPVLPPPAFLANRDPLPDLLLKDKRENRYFTGFPAFGWSPETGVTYGAAVQWFDNGPADCPFFRFTPYRQRIAVAATDSTGGSTSVIIGYDGLTSPTLHGVFAGRASSTETGSRTIWVSAHRPSAR